MKVSIMGRHVGEADSCEIVDDLCIQYYGFEALPSCPIWNMECLSVDFKTGVITEYDMEGDSNHEWKWMEVNTVMMMENDDGG